MFAVLMALGILALALLVIKWILDHWWKPVPKSWCVMCYLVAQIPDLIQQPDYEVGARAPGQTLDGQLNEVVKALNALPCATQADIAAEPQWDNVYVAYRAIWDDPAHAPEARVVRPERSAPSTQYFGNEVPTDITFSIDLSADIRQFFEWSYENCPADHYAVFFWGHSTGPGGLFHQAERPFVVAPPVAFVLRFVRRMLRIHRWSGVIGLDGVHRAIKPIVEKRRRVQKRAQVSSASLPPSISSSATPPPPPPPPPSTSSSPSTPVLPKVEVVLFQDCWMAGLETAFELQNDVRYVIASQSLVPIGLNPDPNQPGTPWEYKKLINALLTQQDYAAALLRILKGFFDAGGNNTYPNTKVLFSLFDCRETQDYVSNSIKSPYVNLVNALQPLKPEGRSKLIDQSDGTAGRLYEMPGGSIRVGDKCLIDVLSMCTYLQTSGLWPPALTVATADRDEIVKWAGCLYGAVDALVLDNFQSPPTAPTVPVYQGVTALYKTWDPGDDDYIDNTFRASYEALRFAKETVYAPGATPADEVSWTQYAFEKYPWVDPWFLY
jgi:hypothetical protein